MIHVGDCLEVMRRMDAGLVQTCVTSPPYYGLRDYGVAGQIGLEDTPAEYFARLVAVFREVRRLLRDDGTLWLNLGDTYASDSKWGGSTGGKAAAGLHGLNGGGRTRTRTGLPDKSLVGVPWRVAFALQSDGWILRQDVIWSKPNAMPEPVVDRCTKAHEYLFLLSKAPRYYFDMESIKEQGTVSSDKRQKRSVWSVATTPFKEAHFGTFPEQLIEPCILAGAPAGGLVLDPFMGAGTTAVVAERLCRQWVGCELNPEYAEIAEARIRVAQPGFAFGEIA